MLILASNAVHGMISSSPINLATTGMLGAALISLLLIALSEVSVNFSCSKAIGLAAATLGLMALFLMFVAA